MATATGTKSRTCGCGASIVQDDHEQWRDDRRDGSGYWCPDGSLHEPTCPPSAVVDQIVRWDEVRAGDLTTFAGELRLVEKWMLDPARPDLHVAVLFAGNTRWLTLPRDQYTAVRRYQEG